MSRKLRLTFGLSNGKNYTMSLNGAKTTDELTPAALKDAANPIVAGDVIRVGGASIASFKSADVYETTITDLPIA